MRRRGNKSHKVPNVKLRPAEKGSTLQPLDESCWAQETQVNSDDTTAIDLCPRPFKGAVICATGIQDKPTLFKQAVELGATPSLAFTDRVTHLVADEHGGAKYTCAVERKIPIMQASWITESYDIWLRGDDVDMAESIETHRLPIFSGVIICPSGISDVTRRTRISRLVVQHQGVYATKLERPVKVTHLLCSGDEETDKMRYAEKFNGRGEAKIHLVWEEWFWDSVNFGGRFDETKYGVKRPRPEPRTQPETSTPNPASSEVSSQHDQAFPSSSAPQVSEPQSNKGNHTADDALPEDEQAFTNVLPAVTLQLWSTLLNRRGYQVADGEVILSPSKIKDGNGGKKPEKHFAEDTPKPALLPEGASVISAFRRANSFAPVASRKDSSSGLPFRKGASASVAAMAQVPVAGPSRIIPADTEPLPQLPSAMDDSTTSELPSQIFAGMTFQLLGEAKTANVRQAIEKLGGNLSSLDDDEHEDVTFIVVRLVSGSKFYKQEDYSFVKAKYRTECWLESCIYEDRLCGPEEQVSFLPLDISLPVKGADKVLLSISGFEQAESCGLKRLLRALGINLATTFTKRTTHLLCPSGVGLKFDKAQEWGIPVVGMEWVWEIRRTGIVKTTAGFEIVRREDQESMRVDGGTDAEIVLEGSKPDKGKGRAIENAMDIDEVVEVKMNGITNNKPHPPESAQPSVPLKKSKSLAGVERQSTILIPQPQPPERSHSMFGLPNDTLGGERASSSFFEEQRLYSSLPQTAPSERPPMSGRSLQPAKTMSLNHDQLAEETPQDVPSKSLPPTAPVTRQPTLLDIDEPLSDGLDLVDQERVPSSRTPSPMKTPSSSLRKTASTSSRLSVSPVKFDKQVAKALQESIKSLLGKRSSPESDELGGVESESEELPPQPVLVEVAPRGGRAGKKLRPQRSRPQVRQASEASVPVPVPAPPSAVKKRSKAGSQKHGPSPNRPRTRAARKSAAAASGNPDAFIANPFGSYGDESQNGADKLESQQESIRVMYEDGSQRDEQKRLISLLKTNSGNAVLAAGAGVSVAVESETLTLGASTSSALRQTRRSARVAGF
ncbi:hypothetical protein CPB83DRAFT_858926 [Crepidotus variabilis]|uniref:BRCT domain-containing protein n=1 Tax=Crepidotus variabilis TaxID=179855 RepID=A0A9P6JM08_9AGAR|nr:hypothetical protein CPB83DRAFT_858926 [Crepidotus variabilis]